jgi:hypothetical protein
MSDDGHAAGRSIKPLRRGIVQQAGSISGIASRADVPFRRPLPVDRAAAMREE